MADLVLVGYGSVGRTHAAVAAERRHDLFIIDASPNARDRARREYPDATIVSTLSDLDGLVSAWEKIAAIVATWAPTHHEYFHELVDRGVRRVLCEKPLANSLANAHAMCERADNEGVRLLAGHLFRYSTLVDDIESWASEYDLGDPVRFASTGGAVGLVNNGVHFADLAYSLFDSTPSSVVSTARSDPINPRSDDLKYFGGTSILSFPDAREAVLSYSNRSSVGPDTRIDYRDAVITIDDTFHVSIRHRSPEDLKEFPAITRYGGASEELYSTQNPFGDEHLYAAGHDVLFARAHEDLLGDGCPQAPGPIGLSVLHACIGSLVSAAEEESVSLPISQGSEYWQRKWAYN
ncbi:Gfo/Idh/MocA family protein [Halobium salinum]|uniref:Gfo/Idh/MocA family protein n=1 Tax=Halobium salinum TaxID=1364940 RepID=A0ABD5PAC8_9EURY|nr:Gfo/Idh/MocA family oxidoreductase [Halobium salinum]